jgi:hypothetical protein
MVTRPSRSRPSGLEILAVWPACAKNKTSRSRTGKRDVSYRSVLRSGLRYGRFQDCR